MLLEDPAVFEIWNFMENRVVFKFVFKASKIRTTATKASTKHKNTLQEFLKNDFHEKPMFAIHSMRKQQFRSPKRRTFKSAIRKQPGNKPKNKTILNTF